MRAEETSVRRLKVNIAIFFFTKKHVSRLDQDRCRPIQSGKDIAYESDAKLEILVRTGEKRTEINSSFCDEASNIPLGIN